MAAASNFGSFQKLTLETQDMKNNIQNKQKCPKIYTVESHPPRVDIFKPKEVTPESSHCNANCVLMGMGIVRIHMETLVKSVVKSTVKTAVKTA